NLIQGVVVESEVVGSALRILQRQVVGYQRDVAGLTGLIAVEHVEIGGVHARTRADERRLPMAGCVGAAGGRSGQCRQQYWTGCDHAHRWLLDWVEIALLELYSRGGANWMHY